MLLKKKVLPLQDLTFQEFSWELSDSISTKKSMRQTQLAECSGRSNETPGHLVNFQSRDYSVFLQSRLSWIRLQYSWVHRTQGGLGQWHSLSQMCLCTCLDLPSCLWHWKPFSTFSESGFLKYSYHISVCDFSEGKRMNSHMVASTTQNAWSLWKCRFVAWQREVRKYVHPEPTGQVVPAYQLCHTTRLSSAHSLQLCGCTIVCEPQV